MDSVYNRKLFQRKEDRAARDQLRRMGGIMSSSDELMQAAQQGFQTAKPPQMTGQGQVISMAPSIVPTAQDMMQRPPQQQMQQPPQQRPPQQIPPQQQMGMMGALAPSVQAPPMQQQPRRGFQQGGQAKTAQEMVDVYKGQMQNVDLSRPTMTKNIFANFARTKTTAEPRRGFQQGGIAQMSPEQMAEYRKSRLLTGARSVDTPTMSRPTITEGAPKPTATPEPAKVVVTETPGPDATAPSSPEEAIGKATQLMDDPNIPAEEKSKAILDVAGTPQSGDLVQDIRELYKQSVGGEIPRDATIDELNRGIFGATMASSKNPRAAGALAEGLAAALTAMRQTEMGRQEREMGLKGTEFQVRAGREEAAIRAALSGSKSSDQAFEEITKIFQSLTTTGNYTGEAAVEFLNKTIPGLGDRYMEYLAGKAGVGVTQNNAPAGAPSNVVPPSETTQYRNDANALIERINSSTSPMEMKQAEYRKVQDAAAKVGIDPADLLPLAGE